MIKKIKIGVMGCAAIADRSVIPAILAQEERFELVAIASRTLDKAKLFAEKFQCKSIVGYQKLLNEDIDAVYMPLPTGLHDEWIMMALLAGKHIYAEKSIAMSGASAEKMVALAKQKELILMEGFMFQYHKQHQVVKDILTSSELGELRGFRSAFGFPPLPNDDFRYDNEIGGGVLMDAAGYPLRATHFLLGDGFEVKSATLFWDEAFKSHKFGSAFLSDGNGIGAQLSFGFDNFYQCNYEIWGSKGKLTSERAFTPRFDFSPTLILEKANGIHRIQIQAEDHFVKSMGVFANAIANKDGSELYSNILLQSRSLDRMRELATADEHRNKRQIK